MTYDMDRDATTLFKEDHTRRIDRVIDYFGETATSAAGPEDPDALAATG